MPKEIEKARYAKIASEKIIDSLNENSIDSFTGVTILCAALCKYTIRKKMSVQSVFDMLPILMKQYQELEKLP